MPFAISKGNDFYSFFLEGVTLPQYIIGITLPLIISKRVPSFFTSGLRGPKAYSLLGGVVPSQSIA